MAILVRWFAFLLVLGLCACTSLATRSTSSPLAETSTPAAQRRTPLILVSMDGFRPDYLQRGLTPVLTHLAQEGVLAPQGMQPAFPSLTFPNHYTLVTGLVPDRHGIVNNTMADPAIPDVLFSLGNRAAVSDRRWWDAATPLWVSAQRQGLKSATMFWPGSEAEIQGIRPNEWRVYDHNFPADARVDEVLGWLDRPADTRPDLITLYFEAVDSTGHRYGPDAPETNQAIANLDKSMGRLIQGLQTRGLLDQINLVVVSDHGMTALSAQRTIFVDDMLDITAVERFVPYGPLMGLTPVAGREEEVRQKLTTPTAHAHCWPKAELPARFDYGKSPRVPPYLCLADAGWAFSTHAAFAQNPPAGGAHGFDPQDVEMSATFIARGPAFKRGVTLEKFANLDVYPLLNQLLQLQPNPHQGRLETFNQVLK